MADSKDQGQPRERRMGGVPVTEQQARDFERDLAALRVKERQLREISQDYMRPNRRRDG